MQDLGYKEFLKLADCVQRTKNNIIGNAYSNLSRGDLDEIAYTLNHTLAAIMTSTSIGYLKIAPPKFLFIFRPDSHHVDIKPLNESAVWLLILMQAEEAKLPPETYQTTQETENLKEEIEALKRFVWNQDQKIVSLLEDPLKDLRSRVNNFVLKDVS